MAEKENEANKNGSVVKQNYKWHKEGFQFKSFNIKIRHRHHSFEILLKMIQFSIKISLPQIFPLYSDLVLSLQHIDLHFFVSVDFSLHSLFFFDKLWTFYFLIPEKYNKDIFRFNN